MENISRAEAKAKGLKRYFTGKPCKQGHVAERTTINGSCCACVRVKKSSADAKDYKTHRSKRMKTCMAYQRLIKYGLTASQTQQLLVDQENSCAICNKHVSFDCVAGKRAPAHIDHCHTTGIVRGILCCGCNTGLGRLGDNIAGLQRALAYLERAEQSRPIVTSDQPLTSISS